MAATQQRLVVLDGFTLNPGDNPWDEFSEFGDFTTYDRTPPDRIVERSLGATILFTNKTPLSQETLDQLPDLRYIGVLATGYNVVDVAYAGQKGIPVTNIPEYGTQSVAQYVMAMLLELCHHVGHHAETVRQGKWFKVPDFCYWDYPLVELAGKTIGIVGFGRIGRSVGALAHAFGMEIRAFDPFRGAEPAYRSFAWDSLEGVFRNSDIVSLNCLLTDENEGFVNREMIKLMKSSTYLINAARGALVNEQDLADALNTGKIAGAALDVVSTEPIRPDNPLLAAKNCLITPHIAWASLSARKRLMRQAAANVKAFLDGDPVNVVNTVNA